MNIKEALSVIEGGGMIATWQYVYSLFVLLVTMLLVVPVVLQQGLDSPPALLRLGGFALLLWWLPAIPALLYIMLLTIAPVGAIVIATMWLLVAIALAFFGTFWPQATLFH